MKNWLGCRSGTNKRRGWIIKEVGSQMHANVQDSEVVDN